MKKHFLIALGLVVFVLVSLVVAQTLRNDISVKQPNIGGKWEINHGKSKIADGDSDRGLNRFMTIEQKSDSIVFNMKLQQGTSEDESFIAGKFTLFPDGRGDKYLVGPGNEMASSTTKWRNGKLVVTHYRSMKDSEKLVAGTQVFALSKDGNTLTETWKQDYSNWNLGEEDRKALEKDSTTIRVFDRID